MLPARVVTRGGIQMNLSLGNPGDFAEEFFGYCLPLSETVLDKPDQGPFFYPLYSFLQETPESAYCSSPYLYSHNNPIEKVRISESS